MKNILSYLKADYEFFCDCKGYIGESYETHIETELRYDPAAALDLTDGECESLTEEQIEEVLAEAKTFYDNICNDKVAEIKGCTCDDLSNQIVVEVDGDGVEEPTLPGYEFVGDVDDMGQLDNLCRDLCNHGATLDEVAGDYGLVKITYDNTTYYYSKN